MKSIATTIGRRGRCCCKNIHDFSLPKAYKTQLMKLHHVTVYQFSKLVLVFIPIHYFGQWLLLSHLDYVIVLTAALQHETDTQIQ